MKIKKRYFKLTTAPEGFRTEPLITFVKADVSEGDEGDVLRAEVIAQAENQNLVHPDDYGDWNEDKMTCVEISEDAYWTGLRAQNNIQ